MDNNSQVIDIHRIFQLLPHRYPMLLIDRVVDYKIGEYLIGLKNVSINEPYFPGHFPIRPVMPGVLILEALAQATGILAFITSEKTPQDTSLYYLVGIDEARFKQPVEPGDQLFLRVEVIKSKQGIWKFTGIASVDGKTVASAGLMCAERDV